MKISISICEDNWMLNLVPELLKLRHEVLVNDCSEDCDVFIITERTMSVFNMLLHKKYPNVPMVVLNWDWYDYVPKNKGTYPVFIQLMKQAKDVWSGDMDTAKTTEKAIGVKSEFSPYIFIMPWEWEGEKKDYGYIMYGSRKDKNKRFHWFIKASEELGIPYKAYHPEDNSRQDYINTLKNCSFYVTAAKETGVSIPDAEAYYCKKPVLSPDNPGCREMWGNDTFYFKTKSYASFKKELKWLWENYKTKKVQNKVERAYQIVNERFLPHHMAEAIHKRLNDII